MGSLDFLREYGYGTPWYEGIIVPATIATFILYYPALLGDYYFRRNFPETDLVLQCVLLGICIDEDGNAD